MRRRLIAHTQLQDVESSNNTETEEPPTIINIIGDKDQNDTPLSITPKSSSHPQEKTPSSNTYTLQSILNQGSKAMLRTCPRLYISFTLIVAYAKRRAPFNATLNGGVIPVAKSFPHERQVPGPRLQETFTDRFQVGCLVQ